MKSVSLVLHLLIGLKMPTCCAPGCTRTEKICPGLSFFSLPWDKPQKLKVWLGKLRLVHPPAKTARICQGHFEDRFIMEDHKHKIAPHLYKHKTTLTPDAYPSIFVHVEQTKPRESSLERQRKRQKTEVSLTYFLSLPVYKV